MEDKLRDIMEKKGYSDSTIKQKVSDLNSYFKNGFKGALEKMNKSREAHLRAQRANRISALIRLLPDLKPDDETWEAFKKEQKKLNEEKAKYYSERKNDVPDDLDKLRKIADDAIEQAKAFRRKKDTDGEKMELKKAVLVRLYTDLQDYIGRGIEFRSLSLYAPTTGKDHKNYMKGLNLFLGLRKTKSSLDAEGDIEKKAQPVIKVVIPKSLLTPLRRLRKLQGRDEPYLFGGKSIMTQPTFSRYQKKIMGHTTNTLRKMVIQHREGVKKEEIKKQEEVAQKAGHSLKTQRDFYS